LFLEKFFFKTKCLVCGRLEIDGLCNGCINQFQGLPFPFCTVCKSNKIEQSNCSECIKNGPLFKSLVTIGIYNGLLKSIIYNFKYEKITAYRFPLAKLLSEKLKEEINIKEINYISAIPLHPEKLQQRGFNQAELVARQLSISLNKQYIESLKRIKITEAQFSLSINQRTENLKDAFVFNNKKVKNKNILLIDDIYTTGSTINEASKVLKQNSVNDIYVGVLARSIT
jgi:competence protein ComFC